MENTLSHHPTITNVLEARQRISPYVSRTALHHYRSLDELLGAEVYVKHENHQLLGSFKMRGALNVVSLLTHEQRNRGVIAASSGNFGQGVAYAAHVFGVQANITLPVDANPGKVASIRRLGANIIFHGDAFDDAREHAERLSREEGHHYVHSANAPGLIPGVGTYALEIIEDLPNVDVIIVPVGGGSGACGTCIVAKSVKSSIQVIGVQAEAAPAAYLSWKGHRLIEAQMDTVAEGLATRVGFEMTQEILQDLLDDFLLVSEQELNEAVSLNLEHTHNLTEHAGAATLGAALNMKNRLSGKKVVLVMSGGNITIDQLRTAIM